MSEFAGTDVPGRPGWKFVGHVTVDGLQRQLMVGPDGARQVSELALPDSDSSTTIPSGPPPSANAMMEALKLGTLEPSDSTVLRHSKAGHRRQVKPAVPTAKSTQPPDITPPASSHWGLTRKIALGSLAIGTALTAYYCADPDHFRSTAASCHSAAKPWIDNLYSGASSARNTAVDWATHGRSWISDKTADLYGDFLDTRLGKNTDAFISTAADAFTSPVETSTSLGVQAIATALPVRVAAATAAHDYLGIERHAV